MISASSSPQIVPPPLSDSSAVDPEEAFIASISSCHMLWFLSIAAKRGYIVNSYKDEAEGLMNKNKDGRLAITEVTLRPNLVYAGRSLPTKEKNTLMHTKAHEKCFIANSIHTTITINSSMK